MKLIKVILISIIFIPLMILATPKVSKIKLHLFYLKSDTVKHKRKIKKSITVLEIKRLEKSHKHVYDDCIFTNKYTIAQRLKHYPFVKASKILAISYRLQERQDTIYDNSGKI